MSVLSLPVVTFPHPSSIPSTSASRPLHSTRPLGAAAQSSPPENLSRAELVRQQSRLRQRRKRERDRLIAAGFKPPPEVELKPPAPIPEDLPAGEREKKERARAKARERQRRCREAKRRGNVSGGTVTREEGQAHAVANGTITAADEWSNTFPPGTEEEEHDKMSPRERHNSHSSETSMSSVEQAEQDEVLSTVLPRSPPQLPNILPPPEETQRIHLPQLANWTSHPQLGTRIEAQEPFRLPPPTNGHPPPPKSLHIPFLPIDNQQHPIPRLPPTPGPPTRPTYPPPPQAAPAIQLPLPPQLAPPPRPPRPPQPPQPPQPSPGHKVAHTLLLALSRSPLRAQLLSELGLPSEAMESWAPYLARGWEDWARDVGLLRFDRLGGGSEPGGIRSPSGSNLGDVTGGRRRTGM